jgi:hypothetical protein
MLMVEQSHLDVERSRLELNNRSVDVNRMVLELQRKTLEVDKRVLEIDHVVVEWRTEGEKSSIADEAEAAGTESADTQDSSCGTGGGASAVGRHVSDNKDVVTSSNSTSIRSADTKSFGSELAVTVLVKTKMR